MLRPTRRRRGFSLVEVLVATVILGIGMAALMTAMAANTRTNTEGQSVTQAVFLAQELREYTLTLPFADPTPGDAGSPPGVDPYDGGTIDDLDDLMDRTFSPPLDGQGGSHYELQGWSQTVTLSWRDDGDLAGATRTPGSTKVVHVQVTISYEGREVLTTGWIVTDRK